MNHKKRVSLTACMLYIILGFLICGISVFHDMRTDEEINPSPTEAISASKENSAPEYEIPLQEKYILKISDGIVVVYKDSDLVHPVIVTDIYASSLRNFDRELLNEGIIAENEFDLQCMLEDYSS